MEFCDNASLCLEGPNGLYQSFPIIQSPQAISKLLHSLKPYSDDIKLKFVSQLIELLGKYPYNPLILIQKNIPSYIRSPEDFDLLLFLIRIIITSSIKHGGLSEAWKKLLKMLLNFITPLKRHFDKVYEVLSSLLFACTKKDETLSKVTCILAAIEILDNMAVSRKTSTKEPTSFFYFAANQCRLIAVIPAKTPWPFHKGFTIMMKIKANACDLFKDNPQTLFRIQSSSKGMECCVTNYSLTYRTLSGTAISIGKLPKDQWLFLSISHHEDSKLNVLFDLEEREFIVEYPKFEAESELLEETFFEYFSGIANFVMVYKTPVRQIDAKSVAAGFPIGICNDKHIEMLKALEIGDKYNAWTAFNMSSDVITSICNESVVNRAKLTGVSGIYSMCATKYLDPIRNVVPLFSLIPLLNLNFGQRVMISTLRLCLVYLRSLSSESYLSSRFNKESKCFVRTLGFHLLCFNPKVVTEDGIKCLFSIMDLSPLLQKRLFKMIMTTMNFWINTAANMSFLFWEMLKVKFIPNIKGYSRIINFPILLKIMETVDGSLQGASCCNMHAYKSLPIHHALDLLFANMRSLMKFILNNSPQEDLQNFNLIILLLKKKPCPCLYFNLVYLLRDSAEFNCVYADILYNKGELFNIFRDAREYPADVKIACIELTDIILARLKDASSIKKLRKGFINMCKDPNVIEEDKSDVRLQYCGTQLLPAERKLNLNSSKHEGHVRRRSYESSIELQEVLPKRSSSFELRQSAISSDLSEDIKTLPSSVRSDEQASYSDSLKSGFLKDVSTSFLLFDPMSQSVAVPQVVKCIGNVCNEPNLETMYSSVFAWFTGKRLSLLLTGNKASITESNEAHKIANPQILLFLLAMMKAFNCDNINKKCLLDLTMLFEVDVHNKQLMFESNQLLEWLLRLEAQWYGKLLTYRLGNHYGSEVLKIAFILHLGILCNGLQHLGGRETILKLFRVYIYKAQTKWNTLYVWQCLKYLWLKILSFSLISAQGCTDLEQMQPLMKITLSLILGSTLKNEQDKKIMKQIYALNQNTDENDSLSQFHVPDNQLVELILEAALSLYPYDGVPLTSTSLKLVTKDQALENCMKFFETNTKRGSFLSKEHQYTNYAVILISLGLKNINTENATKITSIAEQLGKYVGLLAEYAYKKGYKKLAINETENLLFIISTLLNECTQSDKMMSKKYTKEIVKAVSSILLFAFETAEGLNGVIRDLMKKAFGSNKHKNKILVENMKQNSDLDNSELDVEYKMFFNSNPLFPISIERKSEATLDILRNDFVNEAKLLVKQKAMKIKDQM